MAEVGVVTLRVTRCGMTLLLEVEPDSPKGATVIVPLPPEFEDA